MDTGPALFFVNDPKVLTVKSKIRNYLWMSHTSEVRKKKNQKSFMIFLAKNVFGQVTVNIEFLNPTIPECRQFHYVHILSISSQKKLKKQFI